MMLLAVPVERAPFERRVAMVPEVATRLLGAGNTVTIEAGAGARAHFSDALYVDKGVSLAPSLTALLATAKAVCKVQPPTVGDLDDYREGTILVSFLQPLSSPELVESLANHGVTAFSLDLLPRISRAQAMDALSSQATVSGYRATIVAAERFPRFFPMFMTAAGTVPPAKVLVLGAGVAGLQAIATARRLGAVVRAHDVRPAAKEEVQSLGAAFVELSLESQEGAGGYARVQSEEFLARQRELIAAEVARADVVITTAAVPGRPAPVLITTETVERMSPGSVIVDLAAETGGNCELSEPGEEVIHHDVAIYGARNMPSEMATHASFLYARNIAEFVGLLAPNGTLALDFDDEIIAGTCVTHEGVIRHQPTAELIGGRSR
jgi:H+-translocating NAD(P) transhydrogenase subunit alpha